MLKPLGWTYGAIMSVRNGLYDRNWFRTKWLDVPVVAVGNITTGGTGKTPMVIHLAKLSLKLGKRPGIILRGYGGTSQNDSDETMLFRHYVPEAIVVPNADRIEAGREAIRQGAEILFADDAYQHRRLGRDINICLIDSLFPFGGNHVLPAGRLREPLSGLKRADVIILTRTDQASPETIEGIKRTITNIVGEISILTSTHRVCGVTGLSGEKAEVSGKNVFVFSAVAHPEAVIKTVRSAGAEVQGSLSFRDHHRYTVRDIQTIRQRMKELNVDTAVCTMKDMIKISPPMISEAGLRLNNIQAIEIEMDLSENVLKDTIRQLLNNIR
jgi:tetraacyldisaccharide 4'-kinase